MIVGSYHVANAFERGGAFQLVLCSALDFDFTKSNKLVEIPPRGGGGGARHAGGAVASPRPSPRPSPPLSPAQGVGAGRRRTSC